MAYCVTKAKWVLESDYEQHVSGKTANQIRDVFSIFTSKIYWLSFLTNLVLIARGKDTTEL